MYSDYQQPATNKKKIIIVSVIMGLIILALIAVLVNAIIRRNRLALGKKNESNSGLVLDRDGNLVESGSSSASAASNSSDSSASTAANGAGTSANDASTNDVASNSATAGAANPVSGSATATEAPKTSASSDNLPTTGPAETFGLTLLLGTVAMYLVSRKINLRGAC